MFDSGCQLSIFQAENRFKRGNFKAKINALFIPKQLLMNFGKFRKLLFLLSKCSQWPSTIRVRLDRNFAFRRSFISLPIYIWTLTILRPNQRLTHSQRTLNQNNSKIVKKFTFLTLDLGKNCQFKMTLLREQNFTQKSRFECHKKNFAGETTSKFFEF